MFSQVTLFLLVSVGMMSGSAQAFTIFDFNYVEKLFKVRDCGDWNATIRFNRISVTPHPVIVPGTFQLAIDLDIVRNISQTMTAEIMVARRLDMGWFGHTWYDITPGCSSGSTCRLDLCNRINNVVKLRGCHSQVIDNGYTCTCPPIPGSYSTRSDIPLVVNIREKDLPSGMIRNLITGSYKLRYSIFDGFGSSLGCIETHFGLIHRSPITGTSELPRNSTD